VLNTVAQQFQIFAALRFSQFRLYWIGLLAQVSGQMVMNVTMGWLAYELSGSPVFVGNVTLLLAIPPLTIGLFGGVLADRLDQRRIVATAQTIAAVGMTTLAWLTLSGNVERWHLMLFALLVGTVQSMDMPSRQALYPRLIPDRSHLPNAVALNAMTWQIVRLVGPALAGFIIADSVRGAGTTFLVSTAGFLTMVALVSRVRVMVPQVASRGSMLTNLREGGRYVWSTPALRSLTLMTYVTAFAGMGYLYVLPVFVGPEVLDLGSGSLGLLWSAGGIGSFFGVLTTPLVLRRFRPGRVMLTEGLAFGLALLAFSFTRDVTTAFAALIVVGLTSLAFMISVEVMVQSLVSDALRGRAMSIFQMSWSLPPLGAAVLNFLAGIVGAPGAIAIGAGVVLVNIALTALMVGTVRNLGAAPRHEAVASAKPAPAEPAG